LYAKSAPAARFRCGFADADDAAVLLADEVNLEERWPVDDAEDGCG
jgi:hypothetical protein